MFLNNQGKVVYNDYGELIYHVLLDIGLSVNREGYIFDDDSRLYLQFKNKYIKTSINNVAVYAGKTDIIFDPIRNYRMMEYLFGYFLEKEKSFGNNMDIIAHFTEEITDEKGTKMRRVGIRTNIGNIYSNFYKNIYLGFIEMIFRLSDDNEAELQPFDIDLVQGEWYDNLKF